MKLISLKPPFFGSSKHKKGRSLSRCGTLSSGSNSSSSSSSSDDSATPKSVLFGDGGGKITRRELEVVLRRLGPDPPTEEEVVAMLAEARGSGSVSGSGRITLAELLAALGGGAALGPPVGPELRETFAVFDADGDGRISAEELMGLFVTLGDDDCTIDDCRRMIGEVDSDGDGFVCFDDFVRMMDGQSQSQR